MDYSHCVRRRMDLEKIKQLIDKAFEREKQERKKEDE